jgi:glycosyltransferase involved in cell wall biosynthesis
LCFPRREGFPNAVLVATATELAVVSTLATGARYAVVPEVNRLLVPPGNPPAVEEAVLKLLRDTRLGSCMRQAGRKWAVEYFEQSRVLETNVKSYRRRAAAEPMRASAVWEAIATQTADPCAMDARDSQR